MSLAILWIGAAQCMAGQNVPALKDVFKDHFLIGGAPNRGVVTGRDPNAAAIAEKHFNTITAENDLKWQLIHPRPGQYNWGPADSFVAFGEKNGMSLIGHTLVWHSQTPRWVFQDDTGGPITREALLARMKDHIMTVVGRYKGRIKGWDVVNEALNENGTLRNSPWLQVIGEGSEDKKYDFIESAFRWAHEADPDAELYYNDYNLETSRAKCDGAVAIVKHLQSKGIRIDGVGIQLHGGLTYPSVEGLEYAITSLAATGVKVMITELDIRTQARGYRGADISRVNRADTNDPTAEAAETQKKLADKYAEIFSVLLKHRKDITRVTFWGIYDGRSWIGGSPLLFDRNYQPKEAFFAVVKTVHRQSGRPRRHAHQVLDHMAMSAEVQDVLAHGQGDSLHDGAYEMGSCMIQLDAEIPAARCRILPAPFAQHIGIEEQPVAAGGDRPGHGDQLIVGHFATAHGAGEVLTPFHADPAAIENRKGNPAVYDVTKVLDGYVEKRLLRVCGQAGCSYRSHRR
jgi:endo-1,4-beta-xylanase